MKVILSFLFCTFLINFSSAQTTKNLLINQQLNGTLLKEYLAQVEKSQHVDFLYREGLLNNIVIGGITEEIYFNHYLERIFATFNLKQIDVQEGVYFIVSNDTRYEFGRRRSNYLVFKEQEGKRQKIEGTLKDLDTNEPLIGAQVVVPGIGIGTMTDVNGYFQLYIPQEVTQIDIRYIGYETGSYIVGFSQKSDRISFSGGLFSTTMQLEGVTVTADQQDKNVRAVVPGIEKLGIESIKQLPTFLGEIDPVKSMTTLPGVSTVGELSSGFNVRGGESGQNLILQDDAVIYNPTHLFGFFSAFHPDMVSDVALYKGGGPARFGGRVSSVLDVELRNGDTRRHTVKGGAGLISSRLSVEGPILKDKLTYLVGGRIAYSNWLVKATENIELQNSSANFHDLTAKLFYRINENNFVTASAYRSLDNFKFAADSTFGWETLNATLRWDHTFSDKLYSTVSLSSSNYASQVESHNEIEAFVYENAIHNLRLVNTYFHTIHDNLSLNYGIEVNKTDLSPGELWPTSETSVVDPLSLREQHTLENAVYAQGDYQLSERLAVSLGLRYSHFYRLGPDLTYQYDFTDIEGRYPTIVDSTNYQSGETIFDFGGLAPRISARFLLTDNTSLKASYFRTYQYLHLVSNTASVTPQDYYVASGPYLRPQIGDQFSFGVFKNFLENKYEVSAEGFYKNTQNAVDYIDGADIVMNKALEAGLLNGNGLAYGVEMLFRKNTGRFNGWLSYTFSRSLRKFEDNEEQLQEINEGEYYPNAFDQPHNLSLILNYKLGRRTTLSTNFSYNTGRPITIPVSKFSYDAYLAVLNYSQRNEYRIPDYHRLDLSLTIEGRKRKNTTFKGDWVFSLYNVYGRKNAYSIYFDQYGTAKKVSILGSVFPSINYNFSF